MQRKHQSSPYGTSIPFGSRKAPGKNRPRSCWEQGEDWHAMGRRGPVCTQHLPCGERSGLQSPSPPFGRLGSQPDLAGNWRYGIAQERLIQVAVRERSITTRPGPERPSPTIGTHRGLIPIDLWPAAICPTETNGERGVQGSLASLLHESRGSNKRLFPAGAGDDALRCRQLHQPRHRQASGPTESRSTLLEEEPLLQFFAYEHPPEHPQEYSKPFGDLARRLDAAAQSGAHHGAAEIAGGQGLRAKLFK
jgi:hypothetical protein